MSSRVLRKLQNEKEKELNENDNISDIDIDIPVGGARKKQLNINRYDLLNQQSHSESEVKEDDNETEAPNTCEGENVHESVKKKRKKRKKKSGKHPNTHRSSEDNAEVDEVERSLREVNKILGESPQATFTDNQNAQEGTSHHRKSVLSVQHKHLNPNNELKRIFGSKIITEHKRKNRGGSRTHQKSTSMVTIKENWPRVVKSGLSMALGEGKNGIQYFNYEHSLNYRQIENKFLRAVETLNPNNLVSIINEHPFHINALIQLSDLFKMSEDLSMASELVERALYYLEYAYHPLFNVAQGNCRLDYKRQENRALFVVLFKHLNFIGGRACCRTSLELCKLLLSLDPDTDPIAVKLVIDFYALRAKEYKWLVDFVDEFDGVYNLMQLPNFAFSVPVACFYLGDMEKADRLLKNALLMFPMIPMALLDKCSIQIDNRVSKHPFFTYPTDNNSPESLWQLVHLFVGRNYHIWKDADLLPWLEKNVHEVLDRVDENDPIAEEYKSKRNRRYQGSLPLSIGRHIILSDDVKGVAYSDNSESILGFDPLPPKDAINIYTRPERLTVTNTSSNPLAMFLGSLMPNFNPNQEARRGPAEGPEGEINQAQALEPIDNADFRRSVASLVDAMRDLLNNIRPDQHQQQQNDADDDADGDSADDDLT